MGRIFLEYLTAKTYYACKKCDAHFVDQKDLVSKSFHGRTGKAYLFDNVINLNYGPAEEKSMMTGLHVVKDIKCRQCGTKIGWTYVQAYEESQKYKEGKFIIEKAYFKKSKQRRRANPPAENENGEPVEQQ